MQLTQERSWVSAQIGAREHYAIPKALQDGGRLERLYTEYWAGAPVRWATRLTGLSVLSTLSTRWCQDLDRQTRIVSWNCRTLRREFLARARRRSCHPPDGSPYVEFINTGRWFAESICKDLKQRPLPSGTIFFAYDTGSLEVFEHLQDKRVRTVVGQMDPSRVETSLVQEEERRWPGWSTVNREVPEAYFARREKEWALADRVMVNSEFSRSALLQQGVSAEKLVVVPLCYDAPAGRPGRPAPAAPRPLRVLYLGQVILRKGIQYLVEAGKLLKHEPVQFDVVGPIGITEEAVRSAPSHVTFHGRARRDQVADWYSRAHVFVLPTISDGFAITQIEAMAHGLPVISTPNCGEVVTDGVDGFLVPVRDANALAEAVLRYVKEPGLLASQREAAIAKSREFSLAHLQRNLLRVEESLLKA